MDSFNKVSLQGRLGSDPDQHTFPNGGSVVRFSLATSDVYVDKNGRSREKTDWHNIAVFQQAQAENCQHFRKGDLVRVDGKLETRSYTKDGQKHYATDVCVRPNPEHSVQLIERPARRPG